MAKPTRDDPEQSKRFIEAAEKAEADESGEAFERAFKKLVPQKKPATASHAAATKKDR